MFVSFKILHAFIKLAFSSQLIAAQIEIKVKCQLFKKKKKKKKSIKGGVEERKKETSINYRKMIAVSDLMQGFGSPLRVEPAHYRGRWLSNFFYSK